MKPSDKQFSESDLRQIDESDDLHIAPFREDGKTYGTPTWIWAVVVNGDLYVRAYNGIQSRWYKSALSQKGGRIQAAGMVKDVNFEPAPRDMNNTIDEAYRKKYSGSPYLAPMIGRRARAATVRILPE